jgi:hypothetical protein
MSHSLKTLQIAEQMVSVALPSDLVTAIAQRVQPGQTPADVIVALLRSALQGGTAQPNEALVARIEQLEAFVPRIEALEQAIAKHSPLSVGSTSTRTDPSQPVDQSKQQMMDSPKMEFAQAPSNSQPQIHSQTQSNSMVAQLWLQTSQDQHPPASIPSTLMPLTHCPKCDHQLAPPLKASGRQVCMQCGWSDQPRCVLGKTEPRATAKPAVPPANEELVETDLRRLMAQATAASLDNMKPRKSIDKL